MCREFDIYACNHPTPLLSLDTSSLSYMCIHSKNKILEYLMFYELTWRVCNAKCKLERSC